MTRPPADAPVSSLLEDGAGRPLVVHASDLHIGAHAPEMLLAFTEAVFALAPRLVILSGDLTDGGRAMEFVALAHYLNVFPCPVFVVPGNHDSPVDNPFKRIAAPFGMFQTMPAGQRALGLPGLHVGELRTSAPIQARLDWSKGVATKHRVIRALDNLAEARRADRSGATRPWRVLVAHHPLLDARGVLVPGEVLGGEAAIEACDRAGVDLVLSGHTHESFFGQGGPRGLLLGTAPTLSSPRTRGEAQGFHVYDLGAEDAACAVWRWTGESFAEQSVVHLLRRPAQGVAGAGAGVEPAMATHVLRASGELP
jgi:3',5'-cyclic AMP phosphodiesterase CpdA